MSFTPGKWIARPMAQNDDLWGVINDRGKLVIITSIPEDAQLIATAPEMHKVLDNLYDHISDIMFFMPNFAQKLQRMIVPILRRIEGEEEEEEK